MSSTPLFKFLKNSGTSFYCFPSAAEKISASQQNQNNKMYFSKYALLNFPAQNLSVGTNSNPIYWDFLDSAGQGYGFKQSADATPPSNFSDQVVESLRNYVANEEETIRTSRLNSTEYYYNNNSLTTPAEPIFYKWCKKLNLIDFEPANNGDQYLGNLQEFESNNINDTSYFNEILWTERTTNSYEIYDMYEYTSSPYSGNVNITFQTTTNLKVGDVIVINDETHSDATVFNGLRAKVLKSIPATATLGQSIVIGLTTSLTTDPNNFTGNVKLIYNKLVQYVSEINGINNVQEANTSYTEVYAQVPGHTGKTPDVLFRTTDDDNYKPNLVFPILPSQYQPEIIGADNYASPIVSNPTNYPGSYYGQFDTDDFTYTTSDGDSLRRSGEYYGVSGDLNSPVVDSTYLDGIRIDFDSNHYSKMNIYGREVNNFEQFNSLMLNNLPPEDFEFNAILWYYSYEDVDGNVGTDLYGVSFFDNPNNNINQIETGIRFPVYKKLVATDTQDGTAYDFSLNLNVDINSDNVQDLYNPNSINSLYSFNLFNEAMRRLASLNDSFSSIITDNILIKTSLSDVKQQLYTQTDINTINNKISYLEKLLTMYSSNQLVDSDTIEVQSKMVGTVPLIQLNSIDSTYFQIFSYLTSDMYNINGALPLNVTLPKNKNSLIVVTNNDQTALTLPNNDILTLVIDKDLDYKQSVDIIINSNNISTENKKLNIYLNYSINNSTPVITSLIENIDLPIYYNNVIEKSNSAYNWKEFKFNINLDEPIRLNTGSILEIPINSNGRLVYNSINAGDTLLLNNFSVGTYSVIDFSGQYKVSSVGTTNSYIYMDISNNNDIVSYGLTSSLPLIFNNNSNYLLSNNPYIDLNKGLKIKITRVDQTNSSTIEDRYLIETETM
jgi:hypothetical protein